MRPAAFLFLILLAVSAAPVARADTSGNNTRAMGIRLGPHAVGFELIRTVDRTRQINRSDEGTFIGTALWYPAQPGTAPRVSMSSLDYRLLQFSVPPAPALRQAFEEDEIETLLGWRHAAVVPMTREQARASLHARGLAVEGAPAVNGRFPVAIILGGQYYLSTTAEMLASHGFLVLAPFRFSDQSNEVGTEAFTWYLENSVRDAEWALDQLRGDPRADVETVSAVGHGGGGMQAMLFAMRNRMVRALVNIDAGNFSTRSQAGSIPFFSPRLMRAPYLFIVTAEARKAVLRSTRGRTGERQQPSLDAKQRSSGSSGFRRLRVSSPSRGRRR